MITKKTVVKASAGTGKTYRLSLEYIYFLLLDIDFRNILVMTFTKKATAEIKNRIFEFILSIISKDKKSEELIKNIENNFDYAFKPGDIEKLTNIYKDMLINKNRVRIDTIDGFTAKVFNTCIAEPILDMYDYDILVEDTENEKTIYTDFLIKLINNPSFKYKFKSRDVKKAIKDIKNYFIYNKQELENIKSIKERYTLEDILNEAKNLFYNVLEFEKNQEKAKNDIKKVLELLENINDVNIEFIYSKLKTYFEKIFTVYDVFKIKTDLKSEIVKYINSKKVELSIKIVEFQIMRYIYESEKKTKEVFDNSKIIFEIDYKLKKEKKLLEFNDITYYTLKYIFDERLGLVKDGKVTEAFYELMDGRIDALMVDEFQDTSVAQFKFIKLIMDGAKIVTCVGDEKQSIYEWRGGNKKLFEDLEKTLGEDTVVKNLSTCYRSEKNIIEFVNKKFSNLENYSYNEVKSSKEEKNAGYVQTIFFEKPKQNKNNNNNENNDNIYKVIAGKIIENKDFTDTAVLLRNNNELEEVAKYLDENNIRYSLISKSNILDVKAVKVAHSLVKYLVTKNEVFKYEFLRSNVKNYSLEDIDEVIKGKKDVDLEFFKKNFDKHNSYNSNNFDFSDEYLRRFGYSANNDSNDILNLNIYFSKMKEFNNLYDFYENIEKNKETRKSVIEKEGIILTTIHSSKGLEYKNVYTYDDSFDENKGDYKKYVAYDNEYNVSKFRLTDYHILYKMLKKINEEKGFEYTEYNEIIESFKGHKEVYEEYISINKSNKDAYLNLNYVGYTRARENCYIFYTKQGPLINKVEELGKRIEVQPVEKIKIDTDYTKYSNYIGPTNYLEVDNEEYNVDRINKQKEGSAIHYFFEVYKGNVEIAIDIVKKKFGNLLSDESFKRVLELVYKNVEKYRYILNSNMDRYSEFKIFDKEYDKMYIIDLLLIDNANKQAYIYDFKTGHNVKNNPKYIKQLDNYKKILSREIEGYEIFTEILPLDE
ncbi:UvrD-helicase domain-containing protein [Streptobacillus felis]|uniref:DNA 3'-5' helicase n=1 Tax=Streptobacillus felis TaxID=1384509 RepID=A0A7Z0PFL3_9FUSO|nr:UvrD-helicase domain-containing protein [Streptobacillus felis]NYV28359.1 UvrD-helicase domain-containing protein [Streptobacillus felis]